jgi:hypothetical protein
MTRALHFDSYFRDGPITRINDTTPVNPDGAGTRTSARSRQLALAKALISISVLATLVWTAAVAWSAESLIQGLMATIELP